MNSFFEDLGLPKGFLFQVSSLFVCILVVHTLYLLFIDPAAADQLLVAGSLNKAPDRTLAIILHDFEQEVCLIFFFWALSIIYLKWKDINLQVQHLEEDILDNNQGRKPITVKEANSSREKVALFLVGHPNSILPSSLWAGLNTFVISENIGDATSATYKICDTEGERMESELSMIRYIIWAIPSIGFIGTVRGIGEALSQAHIAVEGDIAGMTASLGVAFNSTFVALVISILLMFFLHQLQLGQDRLVLDTRGYCDKNLLSNLSR